MVRTVWMLALGLALIVGTLFLQYFLSKRASKWPGLVLPILTALFSIISALSFAADTAQGIFVLLASVLYLNIPTAVFLIIYFLCQAKYRRKKGIDRMNIQDL